MNSVSSSLPAPALQAARAALSAAMSELRLEEQGSSTVKKAANDDLEPGEIQEVDMESQAANIKTVFSDPTNFNVKVCRFLISFFERFKNVSDVLLL